MAGPIDLTSSWGIIFIVMVVEAFIFGMAILQVWLYFLWYPKDRLGLKLLVLWITAVESTQIILFVISTYWVLVTNFMNPLVLTVLKPMDAAQYFAGYVSEFTVQLYFAYSLYQLEKANKLVVGGIVFLSVTAHTFAIALTAVIGDAASFSKLSSPIVVKLGIVQASMTVATDIAITIALSTMFRLRRTGVKGTNAMLQRLTINAVNRGMLTALAAAIRLILFLAMPGTLYYFIGLVLSSKLYMNSMLGTLNTRQRIRQIGEADEHYVMNMSMADSGRPQLSNIVFEDRNKAGQTDSTNFASMQSSDVEKTKASLRTKTSTVYNSDGV